MAGTSPTQELTDRILALEVLVDAASEFSAATADHDRLLDAIASPEHAPGGLR